jgi:hypothetical protein
MTPGMLSDSTAIRMSTEVRRIVGDAVYRDSVYRQPYTFKDVGISLSKTNLQLAFWQMLNLYEQDGDRVLKYMLAYDRLIAADKLVTSAFYTYALLDPRITRLEGGKPVVEHPDVMDEIFHTMNEIIDRIHRHRASQPSK